MDDHPCAYSFDQRGNCDRLAIQMESAGDLSRSLIGPQRKSLRYPLRSHEPGRPLKGKLTPDVSNRGQALSC